MIETVATTLAVLAFAVLFQALFAGYETGFLSINPLRMRFLAEEEKQGRAKRMLRYTNNPDQMLAMLLIGTNVGTVMGMIAVTRGLGDIAAIVIATPILLLFAEVIPKSIFRQLPNRLTLTLLPVIEFFYWVFAPLAWPLAKLSRLLFRFASDRQEHHLSPLMSTREDMRVLVDESADHGTIEPEEQRMIHSVINLQATQAKEIMVPRIDIQALPETASRAELLALLEQSGRTRIPVYRETIDEVVGVVSAHDVLLDANPVSDDIRPYIRDVMHVPDTIKVDDLFAQMKREKQYMTIVTDEYGGTDGLITLEDILEEIFGDIQDEHDAEEKQIQMVGPGAYVIDARTYLEDVSEAIGIPIQDEEVETVGGWLMRVAGRIPYQGEVITHDRFRVTVLDGGVNSVVKVRLEILPAAEENHG
jgi:putative hemolysin